MEQRQLHPLFPIKVQASPPASATESPAPPDFSALQRKAYWLSAALSWHLSAQYSHGPLVDPDEPGGRKTFGESADQTSPVSWTSTTLFTVFFQIQKENSPNRVLLLTLKFTKAQRRETLGHALKIKEKPIWLTSACSLAGRISRDLVPWAPL